MFEHNTLQEMNINRNCHLVTSSNNQKQSKWHNTSEQTLFPTKMPKL